MNIKFNKKEIHYQKVSKAMINYYGFNKFTIIDAVVYINLNNRAITKIDLNDLDRVKLGRWRLASSYAHNNRLGFLHRFIMNMPYINEGLDVDHINRDKLDNRKCNLRIVTRSINCLNTKLHKENKSGYKGVIWHNKAQKWMAYININSKRHYLGLYLSKEEANEKRKEFENAHSIQ